MEGAATFIDPDTRKSYSWPMSILDGRRRGYQIQTSPLEPGSREKAWRVPLHPFRGGLSSDRLDNLTVYGKANADASFANILTFPPLITALTLTNGEGSVESVTFNGDDYILTGRYVYKVTSTYTVTESKDFGVGKAGVDMVIFDNEIIVAMGESEKIWLMNTSETWSQAANNTFAISFEVVRDLLWRAESTNQLSSCSVNPELLASWGSQFPVGDGTYAIVQIIDFGGVPWVGNAIGVWQPDNVGKYHNQVPQMANYPDAANAIGMWVGWGALWVPSIASLYRIYPGESLPKGPERAGRLDFQFHVHGGFEYGGAMYLACADHSDAENSFICKMERDEEDLVPGSEYRYHEWARLGAVSSFGFITVTTNPTNPTILIGEEGSVGYSYIILGRSGRRDIDDANYPYGTAMTLQTGAIRPGEDLGVPSTLQYITVLADFSAVGETLKVEYRFDDGAWNHTTLDGTQELLTRTDGFTQATFYADPEDLNSGHFLEIRFTGALTATTKGTARPEIREAWALGYNHPRITDRVSVAINLDRDARHANGTRPEVTGAKAFDLLRGWMTEKRWMGVELPEYEPGEDTQFVLTSITRHEESTEYGTGQTVKSANIAILELTRVDVQGSYAEGVS